MFTVTGVTGQVGGAVARALLSQGLPIRSVVRSAEKGAPWAAKGCDIALADMHDAPSLAAAFRGSEAVFLVLPPLFDPSPDFAEMRGMVKALAAALTEARPGRVVCLSTVGAQASQPNLLGQLGLMEQALGALDLPITFLRAAWFMENHLWDIPAARKGQIASYLQPLDRAIPMVATADIGVEAARLLQETWTGRRIVELQGPAPVSPQDVAQVLAGLLGHPVQAVAVPREGWEARFRSEGMANPVPRIQMLDGFNAGWLRFEGNGIEQRRGETGLADVLAPAVT